MTGAGVAASGFGLPDIGLLTQTEMTERARMLTEVFGDIPLIADADTGYGAPLNVIRTVRAYEPAGCRRNSARGPGISEEVRASAGQGTRRPAGDFVRQTAGRARVPAPTPT